MIVKFFRQRPQLTLLLLAILLAVLPFLVGAGLGKSWVRVLDFALLYVMLALGLNIVVGYAGLLDLGYVAFYALGAGYIGDLTGGFLGSNYQDVFAFFILILVLVFRPSGLLGERVASRA